MVFSVLREPCISVPWLWWSKLKHFLDGNVLSAHWFTADPSPAGVQAQGVGKEGLFAKGSRISLLMVTQPVGGAEMDQSCPWLSPLLFLLQNPDEPSMQKG